MRPLLGEMIAARGTVARGGRVAYAAQQPWTLNATVRDNVLFGRPYERRRGRGSPARTPTRCCGPGWDSSISHRPRFRLGSAGWLALRCAACFCLAASAWLAGWLGWWWVACFWFALVCSCLFSSRCFVWLLGWLAGAALRYLEILEIC